jgi:hypothetical protein
MSTKAVLLALLALLILGIAIFRYRANMDALHVDPNAAREIERAKQR